MVSNIGIDDGVKSNGRGGCKFSAHYALTRLQLPIPGFLPHLQLPRTWKGLVIPS